MVVVWRVIIDHTCITHSHTNRHTHTHTFIKQITTVKSEKWSFNLIEWHCNHNFPLFLPCISLLVIAHTFECTVFFMICCYTCRLYKCICFNFNSMKANRYFAVCSSRLTYFFFHVHRVNIFAICWTIFHRVDVVFDSTHRTICSCWSFSCPLSLSHSHILALALSFYSRLTIEPVYNGNRGAAFSSLWCWETSNNN